MSGLSDLCYSVLDWDQEVCNFITLNIYDKALKNGLHQVHIWQFVHSEQQLCG